VVDNKGKRLMIQESTETFSKADILPSSFCYDVANNFIWSWNIDSATFGSWRNIGLRLDICDFILTIFII
jgi:hypothetical protein